MDALIDLSWRVYPASALMAAGLLLAVWGTLREVDGFRRPFADPHKALTIVRGFRVSVIGLALAGIGAAWEWQLTWLLVVSLVIGGEETLESSIMVFALTRGRDLRLRIGPARRASSV